MHTETRAAAMARKLLETNYGKKQRKLKYLMVTNQKRRP
jgi:hypothetical protein